MLPIKGCCCGTATRRTGGTRRDHAQSVSMRGRRIHRRIRRAAAQLVESDRRRQLPWDESLAASAANAEPRLDAAHREHLRCRSFCSSRGPDNCRPTRCRLRANYIAPDPAALHRDHDPSQQPPARSEPALCASRCRHVQRHCTTVRDQPAFKNPEHVPTMLFFRFKYHTADPPHDVLCSASWSECY